MAAAPAVPIQRGHPYRSDTEYQFKQEEADAIVRTVSYHRKDFDLAVIWFSPQEHHDIRPSIATPFPRASEVGSGFFDRLPLELFRDILFRMDMCSLFQLRQTNLRAREAVDSVKEYQIIVSHGLDVFCALLRTDLASDVSLLGFYDVLCTKTCSTCGEFGGFVSLLMWERCCFRCVRVAPNLRVRPLASAIKQLSLTEAGTEQLRSFKTLPGTYTMSATPQKSRITLVSHQQACAVGQQPLFMLGTPQSVVRGRRHPKFNCMGSCALPYYDKSTGNVEHGISCAGCELDLQKEGTNGGSKIEAVAVRDQVYARDEFLEHFKWCEQAQVLWRSSHGGTKTPHELPSLARDGGYLKKRE